MNDKLVLIADFVEGTWDGVVNAWCEATDQEALSRLSGLTNTTGRCCVTLLFQGH